MLRGKSRLAIFFALFFLIGSCHAATLSLVGGTLTLTATGVVGDTLAVSYDSTLMRYTLTTTNDAFTAVPTNWTGVGSNSATETALSGVTSIVINTGAAASVVLNSFGHPITVTGTNDTTLTGQDLASTWAISGATSGTLQAVSRPLVNFSGMASLKGGSNNDQFLLGVSAKFTGSINGGGGTNTLVGPASVGQTVTFNINSANTGALTNVNASIGSFSNIQNLTGGSTAINNFVFSSNGSVGGTITCASANDTIDGSLLFSPLINLQTNQILSSGNLPSSFANASNFIFSAARLGQVTGANATNPWNITRWNAGNVNGVNFTNCSMLNGGTGNDTFTINSGGAIDRISGNGGNDTIVGPPVANRICSFQMIMAQGAGSMSTPLNPPFQNEYINTYQGIANVTAGTATGTGETDFQLGSSSPVSGTLTAGSVRDKLDFSGTNSPQVLLETQTALSIGNPYLTFSGFFNFVGSNAQIAGPNITNSWTITGPNAGTVNGYHFTGFSSLKGGTGTDTFTMNVGASLNQIDGGTGTNTIVGPSENNELCTFTISSANQGSMITIPNVESISSFINIGNLTGGATTGTGETDFRFFNGGSLSGAVTGGTVRDKLDMTSFGATQTVNLQTQQVVNGFSQVITGFNSISKFALNFGTLVGADTTNAWALCGNNSGVINGTISFTGAGNLTGGAGADTFTLGVGATINSIDGRAGTNTIVGPAASNELCTFTIQSGANQGNMASNPSVELINSFTNIGNLSGGATTGTGETDFRFINGGSLSGTVTWRDCTRQTGSDFLCGN